MGSMTTNGRRKNARKHMRQYEWMLSSPAYRSLTIYSRCLLVELGRRYNGENNGEISMGIREGAELLNCHKDTASKAFRELQDRGFIKENVRGTFTRKDRHATTWILTEHPFGGERATKEFMKGAPAEKQKPVRLNRTDGPTKPDRGQLNGAQIKAHSPIETDRNPDFCQHTVLLDRPLFSLLGTGSTNGTSTPSIFKHHHGPNGE